VVERQWIDLNMDIGHEYWLLSFHAPLRPPTKRARPGHRPVRRRAPRHQAVSQRVRNSAARWASISACRSFRPHVAQLLNPAGAPLLLAEPEQTKRSSPPAVPADPVIPFTANAPPWDLTAEFLFAAEKEFPSLAEIVVGRTSRRRKDPRRHRGTCEPRGGYWACRASRRARRARRAPISSTRIRAAVVAATCRWPSSCSAARSPLAGEVFRGRAVGRSLGFPPQRPAPTCISGRPPASTPRGWCFRRARPARRSCPIRRSRAGAFRFRVEIHVPASPATSRQRVEIAFTRRLRGHEHFPDAAARRPDRSDSRPPRRRSRRKS
jgi:hypothetical protein